MAISNFRRVPPTVATIAAFLTAMKKQVGARDVQTGTSTLVGGTVTVTGVTLTANSRITVTSKTPGGAAGFLSAPLASRNTGTGQFVINSSSGTDTCTCDWTITTEHFHLDAFDQTITAANATDLPTSITLLMQLKTVYEGRLQSTAMVGHRTDAGVHLVADTTNTISAADCVDLATSITLANALKVAFNAHLTQAGVHYINDATNTVVAANASDLGTTQTLATALKTALNAHMADAPTGGSMPRIVDA